MKYNPIGNPAKPFDAEIFDSKNPHNATFKRLEHWLLICGDGVFQILEDGDFIIRRPIAGTYRMIKKKDFWKFNEEYKENLVDGWKIV